MVEAHGPCEALGCRPVGCARPVLRIGRKSTGEGNKGVRHSVMARTAIDLKEGVGATMAKASIFAFLVMMAGCTDLKSMEARVADLEDQVNKLQAELAKSSSATTAANKATAASAAAASSASKKALSIAESNTAAIDELNAKIDQMFKRRPSE
jgi:Tfp pilus assembly protein FimV